MTTILQVSFRYDVPPERFDAENGPDVARRVAEVPGLLWKLWLHDPDARECVGVYRFEDRAAADAYVAGPIAHFRTVPGYTGITPRVFDVIEENSAITRAPGLEAVPA